MLEKTNLYFEYAEKKTFSKSRNCYVNRSSYKKGLWEMVIRDESTF